MRVHFSRFLAGDCAQIPFTHLFTSGLHESTLAIHQDGSDNSPCLSRLSFSPCVCFCKNTLPSPTSSPFAFLPHYSKTPLTVSITHPTRLLLLAETPLLFRPCFLNSTFTHTKKRFTPTHFSAFGLLFRPFLPNFAHKHVSKAPHPPS